MSNTPGIPCPDCSRPIVVTMEQILSGNAIDCSCGVKLRVDPQRSQEVLRDLRKLQEQLARRER